MNSFILMYNLAKLELAISVLYFLHGVIGSSRYSSTNDPSGYRGLCQTNLSAGLLGSLTTCIALFGLRRRDNQNDNFRRGLLVIYIFANILSAIVYLLVVIFSGVWLGRASNSQIPGWTKSLAVFMLVMAVLLGLCFILSSAFTCAQCGTSSKKNRRRYRNSEPLSDPSTLTLADGADMDFVLHNDPNHHHPNRGGTPIDSNEPLLTTMQTLEYHVCTSRCQH